MNPGEGRYGPWADGKERRIVQLVPVNQNFVRVWVESSADEEIAVGNIHGDPILAWALVETLEPDYPNYFSADGGTESRWIQSICPVTVYEEGFSPYPDIDTEDAIAIVRVEDFRPEDWLERAKGWAQRNHA